MNSDELERFKNPYVTQPWILLVAGIVLIAAHALVLRFALPHNALSASAMAGVMILVLIKHVALISSVYALFRRRSRN